MNTERIDNIIAQLKQLHKDAQEIMDDYVGTVVCGKEISFGSTKTYVIAEPAGRALNYIKALKIVKEKMTA
jgi:hypothetical protein